MAEGTTGARRALVTGASRGIGRAVAAALAERGWRVIGTCRRPRKLSAADRIPGVTYVPLDLARDSSIESLIRSVNDVDLLINNAGESPIGPAEEIPLADVRSHFQVNFLGAVRLVQGFLPAMRRKRRGTIIFIGSIRSEVPTPFSSTYSAAKAAVTSFAECLRLELTGTGVNVCVVAPWYVRTGFPQRMIQAGDSPYAEALKSVKAVRDRMIADAQDPRVVAQAVLQLLESRSPRPFTVIGRPFLTFFIRHAPRALVARMSARTTGMRPISP